MITSQVAERSRQNVEMWLGKYKYAAENYRKQAVRKGEVEVSELSMFKRA